MGFLEDQANDPGPAPTGTGLSDADRAALAAAVGTKKDEDDKVEIPDYTLGGNNTVFWQNIEFDPTTILQSLQAQIFAGLQVRGLQFGWTDQSIIQVMKANWESPGFNNFLDSVFNDANGRAENWYDIVNSPMGKANQLSVQDTGDIIAQMGAHYYTQTQEGFMDLTAKVWDWYNGRTSVDLGEFPTTDLTRRGPSGRGRTGPSAEDIRGQFDIDELAEAATNIWRGILLTDDADTRGMAKAYVDAMVAGKGKKRIDFVEFIRNKAKATDRYASIYRNKPDTLSEEQYLSPYFQSAMQVVSPQEAGEIAIGGAQFGASSAAFAGRLRRADAATGSAPFINELEERLGELNRLFKG